VSSKKDPDSQNKPKSRFSRRGFLRGVGIGSGAIGSGILERDAQAEPQFDKAAVAGPGPVAVTLTINGKPQKLNIEPRVTLLDALRNHLDLTGAKRVCDRGTCGACTVIVDNRAVYACTVLAIDAQGKQITTIESLSTGNRVHPVVTAFVNNDAQQCGFCTPGFVMASKAFLDRNPSPTYDQVQRGLGGNLCRCGTYVGVRKAVLEAAKDLRGGKNA
jgi:xanthine dehydrogenase YagT iron-sulfur-binding subunit